MATSFLTGIRSKRNVFPTRFHIHYEFTCRGTSDTAYLYKHFSSVAELMEVMSKERMEDLERCIVIEKKISLQEVDYVELPSNMVALFNRVLENRQFYEAFILIHPDTPFTRHFKATLYHFVKVGSKLPLRQALRSASRSTWGSTLSWVRFTRPSCGECWRGIPTLHGI